MILVIMFPHYFSLPRSHLLSALFRSCFDYLPIEFADLILVEAQGKVEEAHQHDQALQNRSIDEKPVEIPTEGPRARSHGDDERSGKCARGYPQRSARPLDTRSLYALRHLAYARTYPPTDHTDVL